MPQDPFAQEKKRLRRWAAETAGSMPENELKNAGEQITARVLSSPLFRRADSIFIYVSTPREPDTRGLIEHAWKVGKAVYVPKCFGSGRMDAVKITGWGDLIPGRLGIPEPVSFPEEQPRPVPGLVIVPCVCAAPDGRRLGHGGGYYDRYLAAHPMPTVCLCFHRLLREDVPAGPWDAIMDAVATEKGWHSKTMPPFTGQEGYEGL